MVRTLMLAAALGILPGALPAQTESSLVEEVDVRRIAVDIRVVDPRGTAIRELTAADFTVKVEGEEARIESLDWVRGATASLTAEERDALPPDHPLKTDTGGRRIVLFFQRDLLPSRIIGTMRVLQEVREFVAGLDADDYVAIVVYQSHLDLYQDFTNDRELLLDILTDCIVPYVEPAPQIAGDPPSLAAHFDVQAGRDAATPESALRVTAEALAHVEGAKEVLFVGWGVGVMVGGAVQMRPEWGATRRALTDARASVFSLDVTRANYHSLEGPLIRMALDTGGFYVRTFDNANVAMDAVRKAIDGHYLLTFESPDLRPGRHRIKIRLRDRPGVVYHPEYYED